MGRKITLEERTKSYKRRYRRTLTDMMTAIQSELNGIDDDGFEPSSAVESTAFHIIQENNRLKSLLEVEE
jgi:hypothetical protein